MFCDPLLNRTLYTGIFLLGMFVMWLPCLGTETKHELLIKYSDLNDYYISCMSWHDGTGNIIIDTEGTYTLTCADGHAPSEPQHKEKYNNPFIREH